MRPGMIWFSGGLPVSYDREGYLGILGFLVVPYLAKPSSHETSCWGPISSRSRRPLDSLDSLDSLTDSDSLDSLDSSDDSGPNGMLTSC